MLIAFTPAQEGSIPPTPSIHRLPRGLPGYLILFAPHAFALSVSYSPVSRLRHWCSSKSLRISPLHLEFRLPLLHSSPTVLKAIPTLKAGLSLLTYRAAYAPFTPSHSGQRSPPTYYRGCWHVVSRGFLLGYRHFLRPQGQRFTIRKPSSLTRRCWVRLSPIAQYSHCCLP